VTSGARARSIWRRIAAMSRDEFRARLDQEALKRIDLVRYRLGLRRWTERPPAAPGGAPGFFFDADDLSRIVDLIRERLPFQANQIVEEADEICRHRFRLLGYSALDYGATIDWHLDAVHGKRAPRKAWYKIDFLDFTRVGDHKVIWELNRHQHLVTLAKAWLLSGDRRYADEVVAQWYSWRRANPYPIGINWASSLEAGFRSLSWLWIRQLLAGCAVVPPAFARDLVRGLAVHGRYIERNLSTYFSPNTHLIGEAAALFCIGILCPQIRAAARWRERGWHIVNAEAARQVRLDGFHFEQSLYYHVYAVDFFLHCRQIAVRSGARMKGDFERTILRMLEALHALAQAAPPEGFGDDDGGRLFDPRRNRAEHMTDPLALGAGIFARPEFKAVAGLTEEALWLLGPDALRIFDSLQCCLPAAESKAFESSGIYVMAASPTERPPEQIIVDAGPQGIGRCGHSHADALNVTAGIGGQRWLIDSGSFCYVGNEHERDRFRGTGAHNTLRVDGQDQAIPEGPFAWGAVPSVRVERWLPGVTLGLFAGNHTGYARQPDPVLHRRFVVQVGPVTDQVFWLVRDVAEGRDTHHLEVLWHFFAHASIDWSGDAFVASRPAVDGNRGAAPAQLTLLGARDAGWTRELTSSYVSPAYGMKEEAPLVRFQARVQLPAECATLILPGRAPAAAVFERVGADPRAEQRVVSAYRYRVSARQSEFLFAETEDAWTFGPWSSNARFLYAGFNGAQPVHLVIVDGSYAEFDGKTLAACEHRVQRFEWMKRDGKVDTFSSGEIPWRVTVGDTVRLT
jgi:hypothetical protein